ncbi:uncharacterized protein LOC131946225, partial [Physella acuta]|uniref:uncharacterized protein LOC131946225 n=1 Tax=Physella acuta TaxID=109671 RepID=UPI0027DB2180
MRLELMTYMLLAVLCTEHEDNINCCVTEDISELAEPKLSNSSQEQSTCYNSSSSDYLTLTWNMPYPVTWVRVRTKEPATLDSMTVLYKSKLESKSWSNFSEKVIFPDFNTTDFFYTKAKMVVTLQLIIDRRIICRVYVTGGRNIALKQETKQSSIYSDTSCDQSCSYPQNAVDGYRANNLYQKSCTHSHLQKTFPTWEVSLKPSMLVNRYQLYNRDGFQHRLQNFRLTSYDNKDQPVFEYKDYSSSPRSVYIVTSNSSLVVSRVVIAAEGPDHYSRLYILTLCEVEIYGEPDCPAGYYGLDCEKRCNCKNKTEVCVVSTGGCVSGCPAGLYGDGCYLECGNGLYGDNCKNRCSEKCLNNLCDPISGFCYSCKEGSTGSLCENSCPLFTYGLNCSLDCSMTCSGDWTCDKVTGHCQ